MTYFIVWKHFFPLFSHFIAHRHTETKKKTRDGFKKKEEDVPLSLSEAFFYFHEYSHIYHKKKVKRALEMIPIFFYIYFKKIINFDKSLKKCVNNKL